MRIIAALLPIVEIALALALPPSLADAETVYRCGNAYSQAPCPEARTLDVADHRSAAQRTDSLRVTAAQKRLGDQMERERLAQASLRQGAGNLGGTPVKATTTRPAPKKLKIWKKPKKAAQAT